MHTRTKTFLLLRHVLWSDETKVELFHLNGHRYIRVERETLVSLRTPSCLILKPLTNLWHILFSLLWEKVKTRNLYEDEHVFMALCPYGLVLLKRKLLCVCLCSFQGYNRCCLVGHDWGGTIAWLFAIHYPEMVTKLIVLNCPHPSVFTGMITPRAHPHTSLIML